MTATPKAAPTDEEIDRLREMRIDATNAITNPNEPPARISGDEEYGLTPWRELRRSFRRLRGRIVRTLDRIAEGLDNPGDALKVRGLGDGADEMEKLIDAEERDGGMACTLLNELEEGARAIEMKGGISRVEIARLHGVAAESAYVRRELAGAGKV